MQDMTMWDEGVLANIGEHGFLITRIGNDVEAENQVTIIPIVSMTDTYLMEGIKLGTGDMLLVTGCQIKCTPDVITIDRYAASLVFSQNQWETVKEILETGDCDYIDAALGYTYIEPEHKEKYEALEHVIRRDINKQFPQITYDEVKATSWNEYLAEAVSIEDGFIESMETETREEAILAGLYDNE